MDSFEKVYAESLSQILTQLRKNNLTGCCLISADLTMLSSTFQSKEHVFISEFLEYLFTNVKDTFEKYEINEDTMEISSEIANLIEKLNLFLTDICTNPDKEREKIEIYNCMRDIRYLVTNFQFMSRVSKAPGRKPRFMFE